MVLLAETLCELTYVVVALPKFRRLLFWRKLRVAFDRVLPPRAALRTQRSLIDIVPRPTTFEFGDAVGVHKMTDWVIAQNRLSFRPGLNLAIVNSPTQAPRPLGRSPSAAKSTAQRLRSPERVLSRFVAEWVHYVVE